MFVRKGRHYRTQFREDVETLIHVQMRDNDEWRARHRAMDEKINLLFNAQIATEDQLKRTDEQIRKNDEQIRKTDDQIDRLAAGQAKTDEALRRLISSLHRGPNGTS